MANQKPEKFDPFQNWLDMVSYSHSGSLRTIAMYRRNFSRFLNFIGKSADDIMKEYDDSKDRDFKRHYGQILKAWIAALKRKGLTNGSVKVTVASVQSFFKYNDLPLGHIPMARDIIVFHNRDITKEEIQAIMKVALPRDRAFYAVMAQSGLRPHTLCQLKLKHLEQKEELPWKIEIPQNIAKGKFGAYFTFMGEEAVKHLKNYWIIRRNLTPESYVFTKQGSEDALTPKAIGVQFAKTVRKLRDNKVLDFELREYGKPAELRLYTLRKYFMKQARQAGKEYIEFWLGHRQGVLDHYITRDPEFHRELYKEKAMPYLRIEAKSPTETEGLIKELRDQLKKTQKDLEILQIKHDALWEMYEEDRPETAEELRKLRSLIIERREKAKAKKKP